MSDEKTYPVWPWRDDPNTGFGGRGGEITLIESVPIEWEVTIGGHTVFFAKDVPVPNRLQRWLHGLLGIKWERRDE